MAASDRPECLVTREARQLVERLMHDAHRDPSGWTEISLSDLRRIDQALQGCKKNMAALEADES
jgi:hypothetical protein